MYLSMKILHVDGHRDMGIGIGEGCAQTPLELRRFEDAADTLCFDLPPDIKALDWETRLRAALGMMGILIIEPGPGQEAMRQGRTKLTDAEKEEEYQKVKAKFG